jgi:O-antigen/teichoic acid export membrane protein
MSASSVALYDISSKIPNALQGVINSYIIVFFPNISTLFNKEDKNEAQQLIDKSLLYLSFLITVCILFYFIWSNEIINLFYSEKYLKAVIPTLIMLFAILFNTLSNILGYSIVSAGFAKIPMKVNGVSVIIGLISNFLLIKQFNYIGAALSTVIINLFSTFFYSFYINKINLIKLNYSPAKPIFISIIIVITSYIFPDNFFIRIGGLILFLILNWGLLNEVRYFSTNIFNKVKILK